METAKETELIFQDEQSNKIRMYDGNVVDFGSTGSNRMLTPVRLAIFHSAAVSVND